MIEIKFTGSYEEIQKDMAEYYGAAKVEPKEKTTRAPRAAKSAEVAQVPVVQETKPEPQIKIEASPSTPPPAPVAQTAPVPSDEEVQKALVAVNDKFGIDKAIECLNKFGVKRGRELTDVQKAPFVELCKSVLG